MDHLELGTSMPQEIDVNEVLREYGLENLEESNTIIQDANSIVSIPVGLNTANSSDIYATATDIGTTTTTELEPPPVTSIATEEAVSSDAASVDTSDALDILLQTNNEAGTETPEEDNTTEESVPTRRMETEEALRYLIPTNTKASEIDETTSRFSGATWFKAVQDSIVVLAGLGGIGSYVCFILSRMKPRQIFLYDDDMVERANLSGQLYSTSMIRRRKVEAMASLAKDFSDYNAVIAIPTKFTSTTPAGDIMICGFDNMEARSCFFNAWLNHVVHHPHPENCLFIDGRLDMEEFQVFCIKGDDSFSIRRYNEECLFNDWQAESVACSVKQTTYCANMIGSVIVNLFTNFISNTLDPVVERDLPFKTYYNASLMYFKTEN